MTLAAGGLSSVAKKNSSRILEKRISNFLDSAFPVFPAVTDEQEVVHRNSVMRG
jgi:hypothetical protein